MEKLNSVPLQQRTPVVDILRGWSLLSVVLMNYLSIYNWNTHNKEITHSAAVSALENITDLFFGSKGWPLLAVLFGYGFSALLGNIAKNSNSVYSFFIRRMLWLFAFAFFNTLFFGGDILNDYAFMGLLLLFFYECNSKQLLIAGLVILLCTPILQSLLGRKHLLFAPEDRDTFYRLYEKGTLTSYIKANLHMRYKWMLRLSYLIIFHLIQLGCFLIGAAAERNKAFLSTGVLSNKKNIKTLFWGSLAASILLYLLQYFTNRYEWTINSYYNLYYPQALAIMLLTSISIVWLQHKGKAVSLFEWLRVTGKATLTNYIVQNIIAFTILIYLKPAWNIFFYFLMAILVFSAQVILSKWWLQHYNYGPAEWLWRCLSYKKWFPLKKQKAS